MGCHQTGHKPLPQPMMTQLTDAYIPQWVNSFLPRQNGRHFADDICKSIFMNEKFCIFIKISLKFVPKGPIDNNPALVQIMAWHGIGDKPLFETNGDPIHWRIYAALGEMS